MNWLLALLLLLLPTLGLKSQQAEVPPSPPARLAPSADKPAQQPPKPAPALPKPDLLKPATIASTPFSAPEGTVLSRYQHKLYLAIGSRWNNKVQQTKDKIGTDQVFIRFHVNTDGKISDLKFIKGNPTSILGTISADSINQSSELIGPFPADLKAKMPDGFSWELPFRID